MRVRTSDQQFHRASITVLLLFSLIWTSLVSAQPIVAAEVGDAKPTATTRGGISVTAPPVVSDPSVMEVALPNGLKVVLLEDHTFPVVSCLTWYRVGSRNEAPGATGISHLLEHALFGTVGSFRKGEIASSIARVGGQFNGYTSDDFTMFFETLPANRLELALKIESERMRAAKFDDDAIEEEVDNIQHEFENELSDGNATLSREVRAMLYLTHPYHNPTMGWRNDVEDLKAKQVKEFYDKYFWPDNCTLVIAGDIEPNAVVTNVRKYFSVLPKSPKPIPAVKIAEPPQRGERRIVVKYPGKLEALQAAYHVSTFDDADAPALVVLETLLNAPYGGRLKGRVADQKVCSSAHASFEIKKDPGYFAITANAVPATPNAQAKIGESIDSLINQLRTQPVSDAELRRARNLAELAYYSEQEGPYRAGFHLGYFDVLSDWKNAVTWAERLRAVNAADIQRVAKKYFSTDNRVLAWLAGSNAPKAPKPASDGTPGPATPGNKTAPSRQMEHSRLTGYKDSDDAMAPSSKPKPLPTAVKDIPAAIGGVPTAIKQLPTAVEQVPTAIKSIPAAINGIPTVIKEIPATVGSIPSAIKEIPGAIGGLPGAAKTAVKELPGAIGGLPGTAATTIKELPGALGAIPGAAASALKNMPGAIGNLAVQVGTIPGALTKKLGNHGPNLPATKRVLKNGMTLVVLESHVTPVVQITGALQAGSAYDPPGKSGVSALVAAVLNNGTSKRGRTQITTAQEDMGLAPNQMLKFDSTEDSIRFTTRCLSRDAATQLDLMAETLSNPAREDDDVEKAKQDVLNQVKQSDDAMTTKAMRALMSSLLSPSSSFLPQDPSELARNIPDLETDDVTKFLASHVVPNAATIVMVGDIDPDRATALAEKAFSNWTAKGSHQRLHAHASPHRVLRASVPVKDKSQSVVGFGQLLPMARSGPEFGNLLIADAVLSNHPIISRINRKLAKEPDLSDAIENDTIETSIKPLSNALAWSLILRVEPNAVPATVGTIQTELNDLAASGITTEELAEARRYLLGSLPVRRLSTLSTVADALLETVMHGDEGDSLFAELQTVRAANVESVNRTIRDVLKPDQATMVIVGSPQSIRSVKVSSAANSTDR